MKVAVASSGLGRTNRGIEIWASDAGAALQARGDVQVTLFRASGQNLKSYERRISCLGRNSRAVRWAVQVMPKCTWRLGWKNPHALEQFTFWWGLMPQLRRGEFDLLHVQDPMLALWCLRCRRRQWLKTREILAHGTNEPAEFLARFPFVQHLAPWHWDATRRELTAQGMKCPETWTAIPNFVDTARFAPRDDVDADNPADFRTRLGIPAGSRVLGCVAAVDKRVKRIDHLIREFARLLEKKPDRDTHLLIVGARTQETEEMQTLAENTVPRRIHILLDMESANMSACYHAMDALVLTTLYEMMPIAVLEALASGLPVIANRHPVLEWMIGPGGATLDMSRDGELADFLAGITPEWIEEKGQLARHHALDNYSKDAVIQQYIEYYETILKRG